MIIIGCDEPPKTIEKLKKDGDSSLHPRRPPAIISLAIYRW
jgi:hypothetical protein